MLRRRVGEIILVGGNVEIEVIEISRSRVKLGVRAPGHVSVIRNETLAVCRENQLASDLISSRGHEGVDALLQLLNQSGLDRNGSADGPAKGGSTEDASTKPGRRRYVTSERYSGYRNNRENPHPA